MYLTQNFQGNQPITWWGRVPVYLTTIITAVFGVALVLEVVAVAAGMDLTRLAFEPYAFIHGAVWQPITYAFLGQMNFFTPLALFCMFRWGTEVEKYIGRPRFMTLFVLLVLVPPLICLGWYAVGRAQGMYFAGGNYELLAGLLIAFATLYPGIEYLGWVPLKWFAFACVVAGSLMDLGGHHFVALSQLWGECAVGWGYIRWLQQGGEVRWPSVRSLFRRKPRLRVLPDPPRGPASGQEDAGVDVILDKISRSGMASLTAEERARLNRRSEANQKRSEF